MTPRSRDGTPFPRGFARFNRRVANPAMRLAAGWLPPFAIVRHRGRRTGRDYATPVLAFGTEDGLVVAVLYGTSSDWVRNVLGGRSCGGQVGAVSRTSMSSPDSSAATKGRS